MLGNGMKVELIDLFNTIQGEGFTQGTPVTLVRFKTCNLACPFCDTAEHMKDTPKEYSTEDINKLVLKTKSFLFTGGETTLYNKETMYILNNIPENLKLNRIIFESNGLYLNELVLNIKNHKNRNNGEYICVWSPKFYNQYAINEQYKYLSSMKYLKELEVKIVIDKSGYNEELLFIKSLLKSGLSEHNICLMPKSNSFDELMKNTPFVLKMCHELNLNFSSRLQYMPTYNMDESFK